MSTSRVRTEVVASLDDKTIARAVAIVEAATAADGQPPLSEHVLLHVREGGHAHSLHVLATVDGTLAGYGHLDPGHEPGHDKTDSVPVLELAVDPAFRRIGVGRAIVTAARAHTAHPHAGSSPAIGSSSGEADDAGPLRLWAHGETSTATALASALGFTQARAIWQMRRPLDDTLPDDPLPTGFTLRTFLPGIDDDAWLAVNARAFADHPEQGQWTAADLQRRMAEPWFSAAGFLIAEDAATGAIAGFHWTKVHAHDHDHDHDHAHHVHSPVGEVYVVGVDPAYHGRGLGKALTTAGLRHLRAEGMSEALLYVDATNTPAIRLYESLGFAKTDIDVLYEAS